MYGKAGMLRDAFKKVQTFSTITKPKSLFGSY